MFRKQRYIATFIAFFTSISLFAQVTQWRDIYKVKKKDTVFGIAKSYNITIEDLIAANPEMKKPGYELKKGDTIFIPFAKQTESTVSAAKTATATQERTIKIGIMLPLHDKDGDGKRMTEYYRGVLLACEHLKTEGLHIDIATWNVPIEADIRTTLLDEHAKDRNIIFGPLYSSQVPPLARFCKDNGIKLVIPFSITGNDVYTNPNIFQVYQNRELSNTLSTDAFLNRFEGYHPILVDCNDTTSSKGAFTAMLRSKLEKKNIKYAITNLVSSEENFAKAFSKTQPNVLILNTGRSPELNACLAKLDGLKNSYPQFKISLYGYTEWLLYTKTYDTYFYKYDAYIPTNFYYNPQTAATQNIEQAYKQWFGQDMIWSLPHFALTGYDQAQFFIRGLKKYGDGFSGTAQQNTYSAVQTPLNFVQLPKGGMQNQTIMLIHYAKSGLEALSF